MPITTYNSKKVIMTVSGVPLSGWGKDDKLSISYNESLSKLSKDVNGNSYRSKYNDRSATISFNLNQLSLVRKFLDGLMMNGNTFDVNILNLNGFQLISGKDCFFDKVPDEGWKKQIGEIEYKIIMPEPLFNQPLIPNEFALGGL